MGYLLTMLIAAASGFLPLLPIMALFHFIILRKAKKDYIKAAAPHILAVYVFCLALISILSITSVPGIIHMSIDTAMDLSLFSGIFAYPREYALNILLFVPIGFLLPALWKKFEKKRLTFIYGFVFSLSIEIIQLFNNRITDIDDLLMNTAGTVAGYFLFLLSKRILPRISILSAVSADRWEWEIYFCTGLAWLSMLAFKPLISSALLGPIFI